MNAPAHASAYVNKRSLSRSHGVSMAVKAGYNTHTDGVCERTGRRYSFSHLDGLVHHEMVYPDGAEPFDDYRAMWARIEKIERRRDSVLAHEVVLSLPSGPGITDAHRLDMTRIFAWQYRVTHGVPVQIDIHAPATDANGLNEGEDVPGKLPNRHAHLLMPTRKLSAHGFDRLKARHLDPMFGGAGFIADPEKLRELWGAIQLRYAQEHGLSLFIDPTGFVPQPRLGLRRHQDPYGEAAERFDLVRQANAEAAEIPELALAKLTENNATFTRAHLDRLLQKFLPDADGVLRETVREKVLAHRDVITLDDPNTPDGRFTTRQVRAHEMKVIADAAQFDKRGGAASRAGVHAALSRHALLANEKDQRDAFDYATAAGQLKLIVGRAGTGKSYTLSAIRDAYEADGKRVIGLAHTNVLVQGMKVDGFSHARTVSSMLYRLNKTEGAEWDRDTIIMVDEAAMLNAHQTGELVSWANRRGVKLVLVGDDRQLPSIERGGLFTELVKRHGSAELTKVRRQQAAWQPAVRHLAEYRFDEAIDAFERKGRISWNDTERQTQDALVAAWTRDSVPSQDGAPDRIEQQAVIARTNKDVDTLNARLRAVRRDRGQLGADVPLEVCYRRPRADEEEEIRRVAFAVGDRVKFTKTNASLGIYNGAVATITALDARTGSLTALVDGAGGRKSTVSWNAAEFNGLRHGYASTIWSMQGKTIDRTYVYHGEGATAEASYVMLTRHRDDATIFACDPAKDARELARQMATRRTTAASIAFSTAGKRDASSRPGQVVTVDAFGRTALRKRLAGLAGSRDRQLGKFVGAWNDEVDRYRWAMANGGGPAASAAAGEALTAYGRALAADLPAWLRDHAQNSELAAPSLRDLLNATNPDQAMARIVEELRWEQRRAQQQTATNHDLDDRRRPDRGANPTGR